MPILFTNVRQIPTFDFGTGGMPFTHQPSQPGLALVGLRLRVGDWIDQVTPIYAELLEDGSLGHESYGPSFGGMGGTPMELRVEPGCVVTGIQTRSGNFLDGVRLRQTPWDGNLAGDSTWTRWLTGHFVGGVERPERIADASGRGLAVGICGRAGWYVDNLSLLCGEVHKVSGTSVTETSSRKSRDGRDSSMASAVRS